METFLLSF